MHQNTEHLLSWAQAQMTLKWRLSNQMKQKLEQELSNLKKWQAEKCRVEKLFLENKLIMEKLQNQLEQSKEAYLMYEKSYAVKEHEINIMKESLTYESKANAIEVQETVQLNKIRLEKNIRETEELLNQCFVRIGNLNGQKKELMLRKNEILENIRQLCEENPWLQLDQDIDQAAQRLVTLGLEKAVKAEADYVILLQCNKDVYGFPSLVSDDPVLNYVLTNGDSFPFGEERRLFYVAMTRAKVKTFVLYDKRFPSVFIDEILHPERITEKSYSKHPNANKKWTRSEQRFLLKLHNEGKSVKYIANKMGRSQTSIVMRLNKLNDK